MDDLGHSDFASDAAEIARLARMSPLEYDRARDTAAATMGVRVPTLDAEVRLAQAGLGVRDHSTPDARPPEFTDEALALEFSRRHAHRLRYVANWGKWYEWDGAKWAPDETVHVFNLSREVCREASAACNDHRIAASVASAKTVAAVERLARSDRQHASTVAQWDTDPWLLNTPAGTIDLKTGKMRSHRPEDHITKITAIAPGGESPQWLTFLAHITNNDLDLQHFLQRVAGYCLTGSIKEHALFFGYGTGGNGKGVFLNTIAGIMGNYARVASMETFTSTVGDRHPTDLAMLQGARLVTAQETEEGRRWAEARIKAMTGGDPITARFMRQDFFTFHPCFKLFIAGNHKPGLRNVDEAIRRRFNLIPFDVKIAAEMRDPNLPEKLKEEWPGILKWMIAGCLEWQRIGLAAPEVVTAATADYFEAEDATALWLSECCEIGASKMERSSALFASWKVWADRASEAVGSQKRFSQALAARGYILKRDSANCAVFSGIALKPMSNSEEPYWNRD